MLTALQAHLQDEELPMALRARLHKAQLQIDSAQLDRLADQLAIRLTLHYQHSHPILICRKRQGLVLTGMLLRRLGFVLSIAELQQDLSIQSEMSLEGRIVMLLDGQYEEAKGRDAVTAMLEQQQVQQVAFAASKATTSATTTTAMQARL